MAYNDFKKDLSQIEEEKISRINSAGIINITLENLWKDSYNAMTKADFVTWNRKLDAIWLILGGDVKKNSPEDKEFMKLDLEVHETGNLGKKTTGFVKPNEDMQTNAAKQYLILRNKSLFLRRLQNRQGKGTAYESEDDSDFD